MPWLTKNNHTVKMGGAGFQAPYKANPDKVKYLSNEEIIIKI